MNKKMASFIILALLVFGFINVYAKVSKWVVTSNTWAKSVHGDEPWADKYYGTVSINGNEPYWKNGKRKFPLWIKLFYDVQGELTVLEAEANGNQTIQKNIVVYDKWNFNPKTTKAYYDFDGFELGGNLTPYHHKNYTDK